MTSPTTSTEDTAKRKSPYRIVNWPADDRALVQRGSLTVWFDVDSLPEQWRPAPTGQRGAPGVYSDLAIQVLLTLKAVLHLPYRALEGLARSLMQLMDLPLPVPDHRHLSRRGRTLSLIIPRPARPGPIPVVVDSTGLKVYGAGEWKVGQHGAGRRRTWRKVHLAVDAAAKAVIGVEVTTTAWTDGEVLPGLLEQVEGPIGQVDADGAYDTRAVYATGQARGATVVVPPRANAVPGEPEHPRTQALADIAAPGLAAWQDATGDHRRSLAENAIYRCKQLFGERLAGRQFETQVTEVHARIAALNTMTYLGMPVSVRVTAA